MARMFVQRFRCDRHTPFGSLVDPDEYCMNARSDGDASCLVPRVSPPASLMRTLRVSSSPRTSVIPPASANSSKRSSSTVSVNKVARSSCVRIRKSLRLCSSLLPAATGTGTIPPRMAAQNAARKRSFERLKISSSSPGRMPRACSAPSSTKARSYKPETLRTVSSRSPSIKRMERSRPQASSSRSVSVSCSRVIRRRVPSGEFYIDRLATDTANSPASRGEPGEHSDRVRCLAAREGPCENKGLRYRPSRRWQR